LLQAVVTFADFVVKVLTSLGVLSFSGNIAVVDDRIVKMIFSLSPEAIDLPTFVYISMLIFSWILPFVYRGQE
jgi:hypothetical protein